MPRLSLALLTVTAATAASTPALMPWPAQYTAGQGELAITPAFSIAFTRRDIDPVLQNAAIRLKDRLSRQTGIQFSGMPAPVLRVTYSQPSKVVQALGEDESYTLSVKASGATLNAITSLGVLRGFATFAQLASTANVPAVEITDSPRFPWRGLMIDVSRHFFPVSIIKRNLDGMAAVKLNVLHWHLADNQGFRVESKLYPKLQGQGSDGLFYTQEQVRDVIQYAHDRGIRVVPEFDMPGHTTAWLVGYPELAAGPGPFEIGRTWGIFDPAMDPTKEELYTFLDGFIGEMAALFPDEYFHIGGDEVNGIQWNKSDRITAFKREHGYLAAGTPTKAQQVAANDKVQAYFNSRVEPIIRKYGKKMMGWDEILAPELTKSIVIQSWRGQKSLADAVHQGFQGLLSSGYYIDLSQSAREHYMIDPLIDPKTAQPIILSAEEQSRILGGEATMWAEYVSEETVDSRIWPRTAAIAERFWSPASLRDVNSMYARLEQVSRNLDFLGLTHNANLTPMLTRLAPGADLRTLIDVVEPVKGYKRGSSGIKYTQQTPLTRLVDAARPDSDEARHFASAVAQKNWPLVSQKLTAWKAYQLPAAAGVQEAAPVAHNLNALGAIGLEALTYKQGTGHAPAGWVNAKVAELTAFKKPHAELLLMPVDAVIALVKSLD
jgi:hexosaminidase